MALANRQHRGSQRSLRSAFQSFVPTADLSANAKTTKRPPDLPVASLTLGALSFIGMMISIWAIFLYAPTDAIQGQAQRIFYFHVPIAWIAMLSSGVLAFVSIIYLWKKDERWDDAARASAEIGAVFTTLGHMVVLGPQTHRHPRSLVHLHCLSHAAQLHGTYTSQRTIRRRPRYHQLRRHPHHLRSRQLVAWPASARPSRSRGCPPTRSRLDTDDLAQ
jgi:hypothetical protein